MNLDFVNNIFNNLKENKTAQNFINELSNYLENTNEKQEISLTSDDLQLYGTKIITKYKDKMLIERNKILQNYANNTKDAEDLYYIYDINSNEKNSYNICRCQSEKSNEIITKKKQELPEGVELGTILIKQGENFIIDKNATKTVAEEIKTMIQEKIEEQTEYLENSRIEGHIYEVGEKYSGRIWLYDVSDNLNSEIEGIEEIEFPKELYKIAQEGDKFIYKNGEYQNVE